MPFREAIAWAAFSSVAISTKPNPLDLPLARSMISVTDKISSIFEKALRDLKKKLQMDGLMGELKKQQTSKTRSREVVALRAEKRDNDSWPREKKRDH